MAWRALLLVLTLLATQSPAAASTLDLIKKRGELTCGISQHEPGLSEQSAAGTWSGIAIDYCRAIAAAVLGDATRVRYRPLASPERLPALKRGDVDLLARSERLTMSTDIEPGVTFAGTLLHTGLAIMVSKQVAVASVRELSGQRICVESDADRLALETYLTKADMRTQIIQPKNWQTLIDNYQSGKCSCLAGDAILLAGERRRLNRMESDTILPERIALQPIGILVRSTDKAWISITRWVLNTLLVAEYHGRGRSDTSTPAPGSELALLMGNEGELGPGLGLTKDWATAVIGQVGNYAEIYERNLGAASRIDLKRGVNELWNKGGLMVPKPLR